MVVKRRCDKQMAAKKGYLKYCKHEHCKACPCCLEITEEGYASHVRVSPQLTELYVPKKMRGELVNENTCY